MIECAFIIPTGNEIKDGTVIDLDSAKIMEELVKLNPCMVITRIAPILDVEQSIVDTMQLCVRKGAGLIVLVGGSGGGHRFSETLSKDFTHSAMERWLDEKCSHQIYGKNGHMWSKLICGMKGKCLVINVPGPIREASAAISAFVRIVREKDDIQTINDAICEAVLEQYPQDKVSLDAKI